MFYLDNRKRQKKKPQKPELKGAAATKSRSIAEK